MRIKMQLFIFYFLYIKNISYDYDQDIIKNGIYLFLCYSL